MLIKNLVDDAMLNKLFRFNPKHEMAVVGEERERILKLLESLLVDCDCEDECCCKKMMESQESIVKEIISMVRKL